MAGSPPPGGSNRASHARQPGGTRPGAAASLRRQHGRPIPNRSPARSPVLTDAATPPVWLLVAFAAAGCLFLFTAACLLASGLDLLRPRRQSPFPAPEQSASLPGRNPGTVETVAVSSSRPNAAAVETVTVGPDVGPPRTLDAGGGDTSHRLRV